jgi:hypothetical protein
MGRGAEAARVAAVGHEIDDARIAEERHGDGAQLVEQLLAVEGPAEDRDGVHHELVALLAELAIRDVLP